MLVMINFVFPILASMASSSRWGPYSDSADDGSFEKVTDLWMKISSPPPRLQTTQHTSGGAVTVVSSCCANCVEPPAPSNGGPIYRFLGMPAMRTRWMAGAAAHKSG